jgi:putative phage-type endonuclease
MTIIDNWKEWRGKGLGSSDAPVIMGVSPWRTRFQLWEEKTGRGAKDQTNWATQRGNDLEPRARAAYELMSDVDMPATLVEHPVYPYLRASLDGFNAAIKKGLEIKCPGKEDHAKALAGLVPEKYTWQLVHQIAVARAEEMDYFSYDGNSGVIVPFKRDQAKEDQLLEEEHKFWRLIQTDTPPELSDRDFKKLKDGESVALFQSYKIAVDLFKRVEADVDAIKAKIVGKYPDEKRVVCAGVSLVRSTRKGSINYEAVPELSGVDLERYRKKATEVVTLKVVKTGSDET